MKHIKMPKEIADKWIAALESGDFNQGKSRLGTAKEGYCCLGLLQVVVSGSVENPNMMGPSMEWLRDHNITFFSRGFLKETNFPHCEREDDNFANINDIGVSFPEIAELLKDEIEYTEES